MNAFSGLDLIEPIQRAVAAEGYDAPTPIQTKSIPPLLAGRDLMGVAQTGTGKTAAFALPLLQRLADTGGRATPGAPRALILAPTRELAGQIGDFFRAYGRHLRIRGTVVFGGAPLAPQVKALAAGVDVLVATPGRLLDLLDRRCLRLERVEVFVLDEADRMLDMGFINDVRKIAARLPKRRQTAMFSATMPKAVAELAGGLLCDAVRVEATPPATTVERVEQRVLFVAKQNKRDLLSRLLCDRALDRVLIFTRTKHGANRVARHLDRSGIKVDAIHGNKSQGARERALEGFRSGRLRALVATDVAARGIDVDGVTHVINFDLPNEPETYVHRIGRTARAGAAGTAISFCDADERTYLRDIEKTIRATVGVIADHPYHDAAIAASHGRQASTAAAVKAGAEATHRRRGPRTGRGGRWRARAA